MWMSKLVSEMLEKIVSQKYEYQKIVLHRSDCKDISLTCFFKKSFTKMGMSTCSYS